jgi:hypothetical protein
VERGIFGYNRTRDAATFLRMRTVRSAATALLSAALLVSALPLLADQSASQTPDQTTGQTPAQTAPQPSSQSTSPPNQAPPPEAPKPQPKPQPLARVMALPSSGCKARDAFLVLAIKVGQGAEKIDNEPAGRKSLIELESGLGLCPEMEAFHWLERFISGPGVQPLTPLQKAHLAAHNLLDPFNFVIIAADAGIAVASNSHSPYGPGFPGFGRYVGVSFTGDMTGEFFGTFLIPSIVHQDPRYHRQPKATMKRRIAHAAYQVLWTQADSGKGMVNYANLVGFACDDAIGNLYVPGQQTNIRASAERYATGLATAPIDNYITEFLPDIASHIHVHAVILQRIINQVAKTGNTGQ